MTYIISWKIGSAVYLAADSALTVENPAEVAHQPDSPKGKTSFGELNVYESNRSVQEGALKIINLGRVAIAMCGDIGLCRTVISTLSGAMDHTNNPAEALEIAVSTNGPFNDPNRSIHLVVAFPSSPKPTLLAFNIDGDQSIREVQEGSAVHFGSLKSAFRGVGPQMLHALRIFASEPQRFLVSGLAFLQSYGIHRYLLEEGVGGAFCGLLVRKDSIEWQSDILFCMHKGIDPNINMVSSIVRDNVLVVRSNLINSCKYFGDSLNKGLNEEWRAKWWDPAFEFTSYGKFDYIVLLNTCFHTLTVIEMLKQQRSAHFRISPEAGQRSEVAFRLNLAFSPMLTKAMTEPPEDQHNGTLPVKFNWFPYEVADGRAT